MSDINKRIAKLSPAKRKLLEHKLKQKLKNTNCQPTITPIENLQSIPLSFSEERMWILDRLEPGNPAYNRPTNIRLTGSLKVNALERAINEIVGRHEVFRTSFPAVDGQPIQAIAPSLTVKLLIIELSHLPSNEQEIEVERIAVEEAQQRFDLSKLPLIQAKLLRLSEEENILLLTIHHIIFDGWSAGVLLKELAVHYEAFATGKSSPLPPLPIQYADFAIWQRQRLQGERLESQLAYWKKQLGGSLPVLELPTDRPRRPVQTFQGAKQNLLLPQNLSNSLKELSLRAGVTLFMTLLAAFQILLYRYTGEEDIIVGTLIAGRDPIEIEQLIGVFINTLVLRTQLNGNFTFLELLAQVREVALGAYAHQDIPFEKLVEELQPERDLSHTSIFQVLFQLRNLPSQVVEVQGLRIDNCQLETGMAMVDLALEIEEQPTGLSCVFKYNSDLFDAITIERMAGHFQVLLEGIVANPQQQVSQLPLLSEAQQLTCVLIGQENFLIPCAKKLLERGHAITGIVAAGQVIHNWAKEREIPCISFNQNLVDFLSQVPFDYLFSIYNLKILPAEILNLPSRGAINLHNALLPKYGGLYATSWAIFNGENVHGLTWHWMTQGIDEGDIIKQIKLPILESETAFTLNIKCYDAALESFPELIDALAFDRIEAQPQNREQRLYFNAVQRPTPGCVVDWNWTAQAIDALIRSLDFGAYRNPFGLPKLYVAGNFYLITHLEISSEVSQAPPGTLVEIERDYLQISTASQDVIVRSLQTLEGQDLSLKDWAAQLNLQVGYYLEPLSVVENQQVEEIEASCLRHEAFWVKQLSTWEPLDLPIPEQSRTLEAALYKRQRLLFEPPEVLDKFLSQTSIDCNPQDFLLTAFVAYLARINQSTCFDIGLETSTVYPLSASLNKLFTSVIPCHLEIDIEQTIATIFVLVKQEFNRAKCRQTFHRDIVSRYPQLTTLQHFSIEQHLPIAVHLTETLADYPINTSIINDHQKFVLVIAQNGSCACFYNNKNYSDLAIENLWRSFTVFLEGIVANPQQQIYQLPLLTERERNQLLVEWNDTATDYPQDKCIHQLFEEQVELTPDAVAVVFEDNQLTYRQLNNRANQLAHYLRSRGVGAEVLVGICVERSLEMVVGLLGILKAGGAYVPIDADYPRERIAYMISDSQIRLLLANEKSRALLPECSAQIVCLDKDWQIISECSKENPANQAKSSSLAYVIYTSGSTGRPKGVEIEHQSLTNFAQASRTEYGINKSDRVLQFASISFDAAAAEIYPCLLSGGTLVLRTEPMLSSVSTFWQTCRQWDITVLDLPTAYWHHMMTELETAVKGVFPESVRLVIIGGERALPGLVKNWQKLMEEVPQLVNSYGPTEATVVTALHKIRASDTIQQEVPIGRAIANLQTYILDRHLQPLPIGVPGELYIGGVQLARGYLNRPELTQEKFIPSPFSKEPGSRLYKTGDLARYLRDGNIEFLGRIDNQVKIRGFRIELPEIEATLTENPQVKEAVVIAREDIPGDKQLVAYFVSGETVPTKSKLRSFLKEKLPDYMVPSAFVTLESLPLTPNGKIDRKALPAPDIEVASETTFVPPNTPTEELLAAIWSQILGIEKIGIHDNFFELGGHSLKATQVISRIQETFSLEFPLRHLFESPTIRKLAKVIKTTGQTAWPAAEITPRPAEAKLALSFAQERLWFLNKLEGESPTYNITSAWLLSGNLSLTCVEQAFNEIVRRHEIIRTRFTTENGVPIQVITAAKPIKIAVEDLQQISQTETTTEVERRVLEEAQTPFNLATDSLVRVKIWRLGSQSHVLMLTMHHIVFDGWSMGVFWRELSVLYQAFSNGEHSPLAPLPIQYADFALWQREWFKGNLLETQLNYWKQQLKGAPPRLELPYDRPRPPIETFRGSRESFKLSTELTHKLYNLSQKSGCTLFMTLLAAWSSLLYRYSGQSDILVGTPIANRNRREIEPLIGFFVNTLVLRTQFPENIGFAEVLKRVRQTAIEAYGHQDLPFEKLVQELQLQRSLSHNPLFQVMFALQNATMGTIEIPGLTCSQLETESVVAKFDLSLSMKETSVGLQGEWIYNSDLFDGTTIRRWIEHFQVLLEGIVANPQQPVSQLPLLTEPERHQLLVEWNNTATDYPQDKCIHQLFEEQVERTPDAVAVVFEDQQFTYRQLNSRANQLAHYLRSTGVKPEVLVGICVERSLEMVVGLLGILKAGGAYVPIDPDYPRERIAYILEDSQVSILVTQKHLIEQIPKIVPRIVCLDSTDILYTCKNNINAKLNAENLAYLIYTSGSTGKPKGVAVEHKGVVNYLHFRNFTMFKKNELSVVFLTTSISFDASVPQIFSPLSIGGKVIVLNNIDQLSTWLSKDKVTCLSTVPSLLEQLIKNESLPSSLRVIALGGESVTKNLLQQLAQYQNVEKVINMYGPTEASICACTGIIG
ncbi:hypothetical protein BJP34_13585 [Moorena producens PAL-8-15-08-1]|uniref:Carrier domain-containing protein n=1 Tax=Moorena producens PAL-8-15-08-1 TaxID=1458985 RepID=A0A1D8TRT9_9CYAN|nr:non-ribosomal peptide synthetase [Moorena producens]AOX00349.1 hypothetical protein BJP34_13585 [Moorena producens PAL-8-15-08-1]